MKIYTILEGNDYETTEFLVNLTNKKDLVKFIMQYKSDFDYIKIIAFDTKKQKIYFHEEKSQQYIELVQLRTKYSFYDYKVKEKEIKKFCYENNIKIKDGNVNKTIAIYTNDTFGILLDLDMCEKNNFSVLDYIIFLNKKESKVV